MHGGGKSSRAADEVVATIRARGGTAVPNYGVCVCVSVCVCVCVCYIVFTMSRIICIHMSPGSPFKKSKNGGKPGIFTHVIQLT